MTIIIITTIIIFIILLIWNWHSLEGIENKSKIVYSIVEILVIGLITYIMYQISKGNIEYPNDEIMKSIQNTLVLLFTGINGCILLPYTSKTIARIKENDIDTKYLKKRIITIIILLIIIALIEISYMESLQIGTLKIYNNLQNN